MLKYQLKLQQKKIAPVILVILLLLAKNYFTPPEKKPLPIQKNEAAGEVLRVVDGDTIKVKIKANRTNFELNETETVRLIGVDTPETKHPKKGVEYFGKEASAYTKENIDGASIILRFDNTTRDRYGRLLCYVYRDDGFFLNQQLIADGYGYAYLKYPFQFQKEFAATQQIAQKNAVGLWAQKK